MSKVVICATDALLVSRVLAGSLSLTLSSVRSWIEDSSR